MMEFFSLMLGVLLITLMMNVNLSLVFIQNIFFVKLFIFMFLNLNSMFWNDWVNLYGDFGLDKISYLMILLLFWIMNLMFMSSYNLFYKMYYNILMLLMLFSLYGLFYSLDYLSFYVFFEVSLIPIILMIMGWGFQPERLISVYYLLIYTMVMSLPFLMILIFLKNENCSFNMIIYKIYNLNFVKNNYIYLLMMLIFLVKLPIFFIHLWLPKAHVEAPIFGSMILAGVLLKMGGYGILRFFYLLFSLNVNLNIMLMSVVFVGSIIISLVCMNQIDLKMLIAYSSVVHMGMMLCGGLSFFNWGVLGFLLMMIGHGICSSGLFCLLNFNYKRLFSRNFILNSGMIMYFPKMSLFWFSFCVMNMSAPPSMNLMSEIFLMLSLVKFNYFNIFLIALISFFGGLYSIYLYSFTQHGVSKFFNSYLNNSLDEYLMMILHFIPMNFMILSVWLFF
uniref:NADH dehydrogenase subunit 4 n=1 Tax=Platygaster robiniae TaxID=2753657 RepID=UPI002114729F|nr:NADH dehydrogenase subunit 4 [Platygaster robiniae]UTI38872.1 NADH dehydrogenase subunit 4 [Platygaster robiniae]